MVLYLSNYWTLLLNGFHQLLVWFFVEALSHRKYLERAVMIRGWTFFKVGYTRLQCFLKKWKRSDIFQQAKLGNWAKIAFFWYNLETKSAGEAPVRQRECWVLIQSSKGGLKIHFISVLSTQNFSNQSSILSNRAIFDHFDP